MRYLVIGVALAAVSAVAPAQSSGWGSFEAGTSSGVGVAGAGGAQLLVKCDKPGKGEVYAAVFTPTKMVPPGSSFVMRPLKLRFDEGPVKEERWRFYEQTAAAVDKGNERSLTRFLGDLTAAKKLRVTLEPGRMAPVEAIFDVDGAKEAIAQAFAGCKDESPVK